MKFTSKIIVAVGVLCLATVLTASAQSYASALLVKTNFVFGGTTNLTMFDYPQYGQWPAAPAANGSTYVAFQLNAKQSSNSTNPVDQVETTNTVTLTIAPILDEFSQVNGYGAATNAAFTVSLKAASTNYNSWVGFVNATNFQACRNFTCTKIAYAGTNYVTVRSLRAGYPLPVQLK